MNTKRPTKSSLKKQQINKKKQTRLLVLAAVLCLALFTFLAIAMSALPNAKNQTDTSQPDTPTYGGLTKDQFLASGAAQIQSKSVQAKAEIAKEIASLGLDKNIIARSSADVCYPEQIDQGWIPQYTLKNCYYREVLVMSSGSSEGVASKAAYSSLVKNGWNKSFGQEPTSEASCYTVTVEKKKSLFSESTRGLNADLYVGTPNYTYGFDYSDCHAEDQIAPMSAIPQDRITISSTTFDEKAVKEELIAKQYPTVIRIGFMNEYYSSGLR